MSASILYQGRRKLVKFGPNTSMSAVLIEALKEHGITNASLTSYALFHKKVAVDLSQPFRLTGIPQNTTLDLKEAVGGGPPNEIRVGVKLLNGERIAGSFPSSKTLREILDEILQGVSGSSEGALLEAGALSVQFMRNTHSGADLDTLTLQSLGLNDGSAMFTLASTTPSTSIPPPPYPTPSPPPPYSTSTMPAPIPVSQVPPSPPVPEIESSEQPLVEATSAPMVIDSMSVANDTNANDGGAAMEVDNDNREDTDVDTVGIEACEVALEELKGGAFDCDVAEAALTLIKYVDGVLRRPGDARTRSIKLCNAVYQKKVGFLAGGEKFLLGLGFERQVLEGALSYEIARDPEAHTALVLSPENENSSLLSGAREMLCRAVEQAGGKAPPPPIIPTGPVMQAPQPFDPYKPMVISTVVQPRGDGEQSITERKLSELQAKRDALESTSTTTSLADDRGLVVILPQGGAIAASKDTKNTNINISSSEDDKQSGDNAIMAQHLAKRMADRKKAEDAPFTTRAMRELDQLQKARVYTHALIKVVLPDRSIIQARFHPKETIEAVISTVRSVLRSDLQSNTTTSFYLYLSPPKRTLVSTAILLEEGLVPAALLYLGWESPAPESVPGVQPGSFLRQDLVDIAMGGVSSTENSSGNGALQYPGGMPVVPQAAERDQFSSGFAESKGGGRAGDSSGGTKSGAKPKWFKL